MSIAAIIFMHKNNASKNQEVKVSSTSSPSFKRNGNLVSSFFFILWTCVAAQRHHHHYYGYRTSQSLASSLASSLLPSLITSIIFFSEFPLPCHAVGYSYARFVGPVSGPERKILVRDEINGGGGSGASRLDYIAHPEYEFSYGVEDGETRVLQNRKETRNGDDVRGVYSLIDPDGTLRVVKYTADDLNGFQAEVITNGITTAHGQHHDKIPHDDGDAVADDGDAVADDDGETNKNFGHENYYEVHEQYDNENVHEAGDNDDDGDDGDDDDGKSQNYFNGENDDGDDGGGYDDHDDDEESAADPIQEYDEAHSEEIINADGYSEENDDY